MFWDGSYTPCHLDTLLGNENVTLSELMEEESILQKCRSQNKKLIEFLIRPSTLNELVSLITDEPPEDVDLRNRYRYPSLACEMLTSEIWVFSERISADPALLDKLCSFVDRPPPLNPLLASFFSKAIEMLLAKKAEQDCYTHQMICLRVLEHFKNRPTFLPSLLVNLGTSAIMDTLKSMILVDPDVRINMILWLESQGLMEQLIQILCGTHKIVSSCPIQPIPYKLEKFEEPSSKAPNSAEIATEQSNASDAANAVENVANANLENQDNSNNVVIEENDAPLEKVLVGSEKVHTNGKADADNKRSEVLRIRFLSYQSANASKLLCDIIQSGDLLHKHFRLGVKKPEVFSFKETVPDTLIDLHSKFVVKLQETENVINLLLESIFTTPLDTRQIALINGIQVLIALIDEMTSAKLPEYKDASSDNEFERQRAAKSVAPHLPLLHQALLVAPVHNMSPCVHIPEPVGEARLAITKLIPELIKLESVETAEVIITLGTLGVMFDMFFKHQWNNFLHAYVERTISSAICSKAAGPLYLKHLIFECKFIDRLLTAWDSNEKKVGNKTTRQGYMGHVILMLGELHKLLESNPQLWETIEAPEELKNRWQTFLQDKLLVVLEQHAGFLGGCHPAHQDFQNDKCNDQNEYEESGLNYQNTNFQDAGDRENDNIESLEDMFVLACSQKNMEIGGDNDRIRNKYCVEGNNDKWDEEDLIKNLEVANLIWDPDSPWASVEEATGPQEDQSGWADFDIFGSEKIRSAQTESQQSVFDKFSTLTVEADSSSLSEEAKIDELHNNSIPPSESDHPPQNQSDTIPSDVSEAKIDQLEYNTIPEVSASGDGSPENKTPARNATPPLSQVIDISAKVESAAGNTTVQIEDHKNAETAVKNSPEEITSNADVVESSSSINIGTDDNANPSSTDDTPADSDR